MENQNIPPAPVVASQGQQVIVVKNNFWKGFFVGILSVVLAGLVWVGVSIFLFTSVVNSSLDSARTKGAIAAVKSNLANARAWAELYYDTTDSYAGLCESDQGIATTLASVKKIELVTDTSCFADADSYVVSSTVKAGEDSLETICVDSNGALETILGNDPATGPNDFCK